MFFWFFVLNLFVNSYSFLSSVLSFFSYFYSYKWVKSYEFFLLSSFFNSFMQCSSSLDQIFEKRYELQLISGGLSSKGFSTWWAEFELVSEFLLARWKTQIWCMIDHWSMLEKAYPTKQSHEKQLVAACFRE